MALGDTRAPEPASTSGGFHNAKSRSPRGEPSSVISSTSSPQSDEAKVPGRPMVAEQNTNVGVEP